MQDIFNLYTKNMGLIQLVGVGQDCDVHSDWSHKLYHVKAAAQFCILTKQWRHHLTACVKAS